jgi:hypothetical protein
MAELRLRQAADPVTNDRFDAGDDDELCALLDCGAGLAELLTADLTRAALREAPQYPLISAEFAEVAWRAARPADAATVMRAVAETIPGQPAFAWQQRFTQLMIAAAAADAAALAGEDWRPDAARAAAAAAELDDENHDSVRALLAAVISAVEVRRLLGGDPASAPDAPGGDLRAGADEPVAECRAPGAGPEGGGRGARGGSTAVHGDRCLPPRHRRPLPGRHPPAAGGRRRPRRRHRGHRRTHDGGSAARRARRRGARRTLRQERPGGRAADHQTGVRRRARTRRAHAPGAR